MTYYKFKKLPANFGQIKLNHSNATLIPSDIYEYAKAFRNVYTRSAPILKAFCDPDWPQHQEIKQLYGKAQSLAVQIAMSNELLLKAILLGSTGKFSKEHNLRRLVGGLDARYQDIIKKHFKDNGLNDGKWNKVLNMSAQTFVDARYGFESKDYYLDFPTLQLLNEALDNIFNNYLPDWTALLESQEENKAKLKKELDLIFDEDYQKKLAKELKLLRRVFKD
ncbi:HEPN domain-containing protein [Candidatus Saccharibacteria bacterium]|nr:HEPN domain-containing protein [Candidatus Saccharibacteria bacterium]